MSWSDCTCKKLSCSGPKHDDQWAVSLDWGSVCTYESSRCSLLEPHWLTFHWIAFNFLACAPYQILVAIGIEWQLARLYACCIARENWLWYGAYLMVSLELFIELARPAQSLLTSEISSVYYWELSTPSVDTLALDILVLYCIIRLATSLD